MQASKRLILGAAAIVAVAVAIFGAVYGLRAPDEALMASGSATLPGPDTTVVPGTTPDTGAPFWHIPYVNEDQKLPAFVGTLGTIAVDPNRQGPTGFDICPGIGLKPAEPGSARSVTTAPGPLSISPRLLSAGIEPLSGPEPFLCGSDLSQVTWNFLVKAGTPDVNVGGSNLTIARMKGIDYVNFGAPEGRWSATEIAGKPAVVAGPVVVAGDRQFGPCFAAVYDAKSGVLTTVLAGAANAPFCTVVANEVVS